MSMIDELEKEMPTGLGGKTKAQRRQSLGCATLLIVVFAVFGCVMFFAVAGSLAIKGVLP